MPSGSGSPFHPTRSASPRFATDPPNLHGLHPIIESRSSRAAAVAVAPTACIDLGLLVSPSQNNWKELHNWQTALSSQIYSLVTIPKHINLYLSISQTMVLYIPVHMVLRMLYKFSHNKLVRAAPALSKPPREFSVSGLPQDASQKPWLRRGRVHTSLVGLRLISRSSGFPAPDILSSARVDNKPLN
jgi:hypothetical protein